MKSRILILILLAVFSAMYSCRSREIRRCYITESQHQLIPYEKGQIVSFIDNVGQTVDLIVTEIFTEWLKETEGSFRDDYVIGESKTIILKSESNNIEINFKYTIPGCLYNSISCWLVIRINYSLRFFLESDPDGVFLSNSATSFHNSFKINNNVYYDVVETIATKSDNNGSYKIPDQLFYNKTYGILQIIRDGENFLTINN